VRGKDSVVLVCQKKVADKLIDPTSVTSMFKVNETIGAVCSGNISDAKAAMLRARHVAAEFQYKNGYSIPVHVAAGKHASNSQVYTQHAFMRAFAVFSIYAGLDDEKGPQLFMADPAGHFAGYLACAAGPKEQEANAWLEKHVKPVEKMTFEYTMETAIMCLQNVLGFDLRASDLEVAVVQAKQTKFTTLSPDQIDAHLTAISDRD
jgi:20S proteasome subunit alpha 1